MSRQKQPVPTPPWVNPAAKTVRGLHALAHAAAALADLPLERPSERPAPRSDDTNYSIGG